MSSAPIPPRSSGDRTTLVRALGRASAPFSNVNTNHRPRSLLSFLVGSPSDSSPSLSPPLPTALKMSKSIFAELPLFIPKEQLPSLPVLAALVFIGLPVLAIALNVASQLVSRLRQLLNRAETSSGPGADCSWSSEADTAVASRSAPLAHAAPAEGPDPAPGRVSPDPMVRISSRLRSGPVQVHV